MTREQRARMQTAISSLDEARTILQSIADELNAEFDERSERWQESEKGETHGERAGAIEDAALQVDDLLTLLEEALS